MQEKTVFFFIDVLVLMKSDVGNVMLIFVPICCHEG